MRNPERSFVVKGFQLSLISWGNTHLAAYSLSGNFFCELTFIITIIYLRGTNNKRQTLLQPGADRKVQNNSISRSCYHWKQHRGHTPTLGKIITIQLHITQQIFGPCAASIFAESNI